MNLLDLMVKISVDDQASGKVKSLSDGIKGNVKGGAESASGSLSKLTGAFSKASADSSSKLGKIGQAAAKLPGPIGKVASAAPKIGSAVSKASGVAKSALSKLAPALGKVKSGIGTLGKVAAIGAGAVSAGAGAATAAIIGNARDVAEYGDNIDKMSQKMGLTASAYQEWDAVMQHSGTSMEAMKAGMKTLANAAESGNEAFEKIGITQEQIASMDQQQLFEATIAGLQNVEGTTERTYLAGKLLGRGATELGPLLNTSAEETQAMRDRVHELGGVMSDEAVKASAHFQDSLQDLQTAAEGVKRSFIGELLPGVNQVMDGLQEIMVGNTDKGMEQVVSGVETTIEKIGEAAPKFIAVGAKIVMGLAQAAVENFPRVTAALLNGLAGAWELLGQAIPKLLPEIGQALLEGMPQVHDAALNLFSSFGRALAEVVPVLIDAVGYVITHLPEIVIGGIGGMVEAGGAFFGGIVDGFLGKQPEVEQVAGNVTKAAGDAALANADGSAASSQWMDTFNSKFDFSATEQEAAAGAKAVTDAAAESADGAPIAEKLNESSQAGIDKTAMNAPAEEMVRNAATAAKAIDVSEIGQKFSSSAASGMDTSAISDKMASISKAASAASTTVKIGVQADTSGVKAVAAAASSIPAAFSSASTKAVASLGLISAKATQVAASVRTAMNSIPSSKTVSLKFDKPHIPVPHWSMSGTFNPKTGSTPSVSTWWGAEGGILTKATIFGAGEAGPEAVLPLTKLEKMLDESNGKYQGGGDTYNVTIYAQPGDGPEQMVMAFTQAIETRNRMRGRTTARKAVRSL